MAETRRTTLIALVIAIPDVLMDAAVVALRPPVEEELFKEVVQPRPGSAVSRSVSQDRISLSLIPHIMR